MPLNSAASMMSSRRVRRRQVGLSMVELMVGVAIGLFIVAGAAMLAATQLGENRRLLLETQLQQDLRATADIITRELRRSGSTAATENFVWSSVNPSAVPNPYAPVTVSGGGTRVDYNYTRTTAATSPSAFQLLSTGKVQTRLPGAVSWQDLTDGQAIVVTSFSVTPREVDEPTPAAPNPRRLPCPRLCADGTSNCWPVLKVRELQIDISAHAAADPTVRRSLRSIVRQRNDEITGSCPA